jgi:hypothetical protein
MNHVAPSALSYFAETMTAIAEGLEEPSAVARDGQRGMPIVMDT